MRCVRAGYHTYCAAHSNVGVRYPESYGEVWAWVGSFVILSIPFWFIIGAIAGWALHLHGWTRTSLVLSATPLLAALISWLLFGAI